MTYCWLFVLVEGICKPLLVTCIGVGWTAPQWLSCPAGSCVEAIEQAEVCSPCSPTAKCGVWCQAVECGLWHAAVIAVAVPIARVGEQCVTGGGAALCCVLL